MQLQIHHLAPCATIPAHLTAAVAAKSLQSCPTLCEPIDGSPPGSPVPGILQARTLEWVAISFCNAWKWKWKWSLSVMSDSSRPHGLKPTRLFRPWDSPGKSTGVGCHCLLPHCLHTSPKNWTLNKKLPSASHVLLLSSLLPSVRVKAGESVLGQVEELEEQHAKWSELLA